MVEFLRWFRSSGRSRDTLLLVFSDHGARFSRLRATLQGRLEERLPLMAVVLPQKLREQVKICALHAFSLDRIFEDTYLRSAQCNVHP